MPAVIRTTLPFVGPEFYAYASNAKEHNGEPEAVLEIRIRNLCIMECAAALFQPCTVVEVIRVNPCKYFFVPRPLVPLRFRDRWRRGRSLLRGDCVPGLGIRSGSLSVAHAPDDPQQCEYCSNESCHELLGASAFPTWRWLALRST